MSNNVWADLGFNEPEAMQRKCDLSIEIERLMDRARISKRRAAAQIGITETELAAILDADVQMIDLAVLEGYRDILKGAVAQRG